MTKRLTLTALTALIATPIMAHPGHDTPVATHWMSDLPHLAVVGLLAALAVLVIGVVLRVFKHRRAKE